MAEVPEHLLRRSQERRKALGLPVDGDDAGGEPAPASESTDAPAAEATDDVAADAPAAAADEGEAVTESKGGVPAHLLERSRKRKAALAGGGDAAPAAAGGGGTATATKARTAAATAPAPAGTGPGGHTQRLLTVVKAGSIQQTRAEAQDKVHVWPHLLAIEFAAVLILMALITVFSALVKAPLLGLADLNQTPNPSKAPWYFLGLQELLTMFHPMVAGVTIPGVALGILAITPYFDQNPSTKPNDRKFAIVMMTIFLMLWAVLVIIGSFFRGPGFNFVFPWNEGIFFEL
ncbi:MAG TPA: menaquinol-cytochrome c reductase cytochrome b subunit [Acidimicrobiia bacterium]|nr:menaquinol-cytochrome c reductase cytochrome b subunit [Acidimicrobiia bacterium]